jgi:hypothetical protein
VISLKVVGSIAYERVGVGDAESAFSFLLVFLLHKFLVVFLNAFERHYGMEETVGGFWGSDFLFDYELW